MNHVLAKAHLFRNSPSKMGAPLAVVKVVKRVLALFMLSMISSALMVHELNVEIELTEESSLQKFCFHLFSERELNSLSIRVPEDAQISSDLPFSVEDGNLHILKRIYGDQKICFSIKTKEGLYFSNDKGAFIFSFKPWVKLERCNLKIRLSDLYVDRERGIDPVYPNPEKIMMGEKLELVWSFENPHTIYVNVLLKKWEKREFPLFIIPLSLLIILLPLAILVKKREESWKRYLKEDERKVFELIKENPGIRHKEIWKRTGFSKAKVTRLLKNLEERGLIRHEGEGKRKRFFLR